MHARGLRGHARTRAREPRTHTRAPGPRTHEGSGAAHAHEGSGAADTRLTQPSPQSPSPPTPTPAPWALPLDPRHHWPSPSHPASVAVRGACKAFLIDTNMPGSLPGPGSVSGAVRTQGHLQGGPTGVRTDHSRAELPPGYHSPSKPSGRPAVVVPFTWHEGTSASYSVRRAPSPGHSTRFREVSVGTWTLSLPGNPIISLSDLDQITGTDWRAW